jgi:hypothetical protein
MMNGEIGFEDYFEWNITMEYGAQGSTQILLLMFIVMFCIVLVNLLVGLAVSEIEKEMMAARKLQNQIAVAEIDRYWKSLHKSTFLKVLEKLCCCSRKTKGKSNYAQQLTGPNGVFKSLKKEWIRLANSNKELPESRSCMWKVCIDPNKVFNAGKWGRKTRKEYEVYFFDSRYNRRFEAASHKTEDGEHGKNFYETGFYLSQEVVSETITWLRENKTSEKSKIEQNGIAMD